MNGQAGVDPLMEEQPDSIRTAHRVVTALVAHGVRDVVYCPGSRSAPFAYVLHAAEEAGVLRAHVRLDERGAAFLAVGLSKGAALRGGEPAPVAVAVTSGGAVAELHAGVAEASHARLPIIVVSADRPFELRGVGASQTTDQVGIFASHVRACWDVPAGAHAPERLGALVARAVARAQGRPWGTPGPVQLNVGLRDPLVPAPGVALPAPAVPVPGRARSEVGPRVLAGTPSRVPWEDVVDPALRTVIVAGDGAGPDVVEWADRGSIPLFAEASSGATPAVQWMPHQQALLAHSPLSARIEQVVVTGRPTLSRPVSALLARPDLRVVVVEPAGEWVDVAGRAAVVVPGLAAPIAAADPAWAGAWREECARMGAHVAEVVAAAGERPTAAGVALEVWRSAQGVLVLGASNSVRLVDLVAGGPGRAKVCANRGLAGIDGTVATALGVARASGEPVTALMGDLTFLHDATSLAVAPEEPGVDLRIVVLDDSGGSIFASLEHGRSDLAPVHERWFAVGQRTSIPLLARAHGLAHVTVGSMGDLREVLARPIRGFEVVHVPVGREGSQLAALRSMPQPG